MMGRAALGFTILELMAVVIVTGILLALAVPAFMDLQARRRVEGVANELSADLQYARTEAVSRQLDVALATRADGRGYTLTAMGAAPTVIKTVVLPQEVSLSPGVTLTYTALRGIPNETSGGDRSILVSSSGTGARLRLDSNFMGRVQLCSPGGGFKGYAPCAA